MVETFYSKNGVPIEEDVNWGYDSRYEVVQTPILKTMVIIIMSITLRTITQLLSFTHLESLDFIRL